MFCDEHFDEQQYPFSNTILGFNYIFYFEKLSILLYRFYPE